MKLQNKNYNVCKKNSPQNIPVITTNSDEEFAKEPNGHYKIDMETNDSSNNLSMADSTRSQENLTYNWTTMTPQEISIWIDRRARFVFPLAFIVFNALFWTFVYVL